MLLRNLILLEAQITSFEDWQRRETDRIKKAILTKRGGIPVDDEGRSPNYQAMLDQIELPEEYENKFQHLKDWVEARNIPIATLQSYTLERAEKKAEEWIKLLKQRQPKTAGEDEEAKGRRIVVNDDKWMVLVPKTGQDASRYAAGTNWCTANPGTAEGYMKQGDLYVIIDKVNKTTQPKTGEQIPVKYQFHPATNQYMDINDRRVPSLSKFDFLPKILIDDGSMRSFEVIMTDFPKMTRAFIEKNISKPDGRYMNAALSAKNIEAYQILKEMGAPVPDNIFSYMKDDFFLPDEDMRYLISSGTDMASGEYAPFRYAIKSGDMKLLNEVIKRYDKYQKEHHRNVTLSDPINYAVSKNSLESLEVFFSDPSFKDFGVVKVATKDDKPEVVQMMLGYPNIDPAVDDNEPVKFALGMRKEETANVLLSDKRVIDKMASGGLLDKYQQAGWIKQDGGRWVSGLPSVKPAKKKKVKAS